MANPINKEGLELARTVNAKLVAIRAEIAALEEAIAGIGGAAAFADLTDKATADLPAINGPLSTALSGKAAASHTHADLTAATKNPTASTIVKRGVDGEAEFASYVKVYEVGGSDNGLLSSTGLTWLKTGVDEATRTLSVQFEEFTGDRIWKQPNASGTYALTASTTGIPDKLHDATLSGTLSIPSALTTDSTTKTNLRNAAGLGLTDTLNIANVVASGVVTANGDITVSKANAFLKISATSGYAGFRFQNSGIDRWTTAIDESSKNYIISRFDVTGSYQNNPFQIESATGSIIFTGDLTVGGTIKTTDTTASTGVDSGCATFAGGIGVWGQVTAGFMLVEVSSGNAAAKVKSGSHYTEFSSNGSDAYWALPTGNFYLYSTADGIGERARITTGGMSITGTIKTGSYTTANAVASSHATAIAAGDGAQSYISDIDKPVWSNGTVWKLADGTTLT